VFIGEILANMTQVSDVAPGPLVEKYFKNALWSMILQCTSLMQKSKPKEKIAPYAC
jgi:hypothetical protein